MSEWTKQGVFDRAVAGLAAQGFNRAMNSGNRRRCAYRGEAGTKCAIGHCIPDDKYDPKWDGEVGKNGDDVLHAIGVPDVDGLYAFAISLQRTHDTFGEPEAMRLALRELGLRFGLRIPTELRAPSALSV